MLRRQAKFVGPLLFASDTVMATSAVVAAYYLRFATDWIEITKGVPSFSLYLTLLPMVLAINWIVFASFGLYRDTSSDSRFGELWRTLWPVTLAFLIIMAAANMFQPYKFSRLVFIYLWGMEILTIWLGRSLIGFTLGRLRKKGYNLTRVLMVGAGELGAQVARRLKAHSELGVKIIGFISRHTEKLGTEVAGEKVLGGFEELDSLIAKHAVNTVIIALPLDAHERVANTITHLSDATVNVMIVPDLYQFVTLRGGVEELDGLPVINLQDTPLYGWQALAKRTFDIAFSGTVLLLLSPLLLAIALGIKLSSPGPVSYSQERMGLDGNCFNMYKFRSMKVDAEKETGAVWAVENDPRRTRFGSFIRKFSIDELLQFYNVLIGDMSIVGPRPERPEFISDFRTKIPKYMLRHKVRAGITGWAQINGLRGNTSLERRIEYDLYYIENWSFFYDIKIILLTVFVVFRDPNAY
jgi:Undecaprenyl-phosphate glucose phosphotransferase